jgi:hypothetical protein
MIRSTLRLNGNPSACTRDTVSAPCETISIAFCSPRPPKKALGAVLRRPNLARRRPTLRPCIQSSRRPLGRSHRIFGGRAMSRLSETVLLLRRLGVRLGRMGNHRADGGRRMQRLIRPVHPCSDTRRGSSRSTRRVYQAASCRPLRPTFSFRSHLGLGRRAQPQGDMSRKLVPRRDGREITETSTGGGSNSGRSIIRASRD